ncbi:MAG: tRNA1(Val) (adenine(37)-N6)-methyltransferase [Lachnospiraceae bacterium]|nr:tRNA1(Val) (adenine(37)-N6)-methyltransferase [Lachnospiraceae bacterium]
MDGLFPYNFLDKDERLDDLGIAGLSIIQNTKSFCFGMDAVLLSAFAKVHSGETVVDLCSGNGILPILLSAKTEASHIWSIELLPKSVDLAHRSVVMNGLEDRITILEGDVKKASELLENRQFDVVTCNPPYMKGGLLNEKDDLKIARHEITLDLGSLAKQIAVLLRPKGRVYFVHRPYRLTELFVEMHSAGIEPKILRFVHPFADKKPNLVLVEGVKGAKPFLEVEPPLVVYQSLNVYTPEVMKMYGYENNLWVEGQF